MPIALFTNICTPIGLVNKVKYISKGIVPDDDDILNLELVNHQINNCSNIFLL